jgi:serine/threonine-protein kinase
MAISPDGSAIVHSGGSSGLLHLLPVDGGPARPLAGSDGASIPLFSPDGQWVGFFAGGKLLKLPVAGGTPVTLCDNCPGASATWAADGRIIFERGGLWSVPDSGGVPQPLTQLVAGQASHSWPDMLPGGKAIIFTSTTSLGWNYGDVVLKNLETGEQRSIAVQATTARYVPTGHVAYVQGGVLKAAPFDLDALDFTGPAFTVLENVMESSSGAAHYSVSASGALAYVPGGILGGDRTLVSVDRSGKEEPFDAPKRRYGYFRLSPDGETLAIQIDWPGIEIWLYKFPDRSLTQLTRGGAEFPWWTPDGSRVTFFSSRSGVPNIFWQRADGTGEAEQLTRSEHPVDHSFSWSPDGRTLAFTVNHPETDLDIWMQPTGDPAQARPYLRTDSRECCPVFSPDGRRIAYLSNQSGQSEVYLSPIPGPARPMKVSADGGVEPLWSRDGKELFYWSNDRQLMAVEVPSDTSLASGAARPLFGGTFLSAAASWRTRIDITPDGRRFILIRRGAQEDETKELRMIPNWFAQLTERFAAQQ